MPGLRDSILLSRHAGGESVTSPLPVVEMATAKHCTGGSINNQAHVDGGKLDSKGHYHEETVDQEADRQCFIAGGQQPPLLLHGSP